MAEPEEYLALKLLTDAFDCLNIDYAIAGSIASSLYGKVRFTQDVDINAAVTPEKAGPLYSVLKEEFYIGRDAMYQAIANRTSFNVVHLASAFKIDVFIRKDDDFHEQLFLRRRKVKLDELTNYFFDIVSPEDVILLKLQWYESAGRTSERQWSDVLGVLAVQAESLDMAYLKSSSKKLGIDGLLEKAVKESRE